MPSVGAAPTMNSEGRTDLFNRLTARSRARQFAGHLLRCDQGPETVFGIAVFFGVRLAGSLGGFTEVRFTTFSTRTWGGLGSSLANFVTSRITSMN